MIDDARKSLAAQSGRGPARLSSIAETGEARPTRSDFYWRQ